MKDENKKETHKSKYNYHLKTWLTKFAFKGKNQQSNNVFINGKQRMQDCFLKMKIKKEFLI
jgi:hypothetical protein